MMGLFAVEETIGHFRALGPGLQDRTDAHRWRWRGKAGAGFVHGDGAFQAEDGLLVGIDMGEALDKVA